MSEFSAYLQLGFAHITASAGFDTSGYDHILFVVALCAIYEANEWKKIVVLVTAFTIGHSITLALSTLQIVNYRADIIELLIPITIFVTALSNYRQKPSGEVELAKLRYISALLFGLIHGLGFSTYLRSLLGSEGSIVAPLFAFNLGLELGQLVIVAITIILATFCLKILKVKRFTWNHLISGIVAGMALALFLPKIMALTK